MVIPSDARIKDKVHSRLNKVNFRFKKKSNVTKGFVRRSRMTIAEK